MGGANRKSITGRKKDKPSRKLMVIVSILLVLIAGYVGIKSLAGGNGKSASAGGDLTIPKSEISETAKFYQYKAGKTTMEVVAVKASDGTIRTAFNTCQVCFDSGKGYYVQQGDVLVCQNCKNRFKMDQVEKVKGGCNPVPIMEEDKTDDGSNIVIPGDFLVQNKDLFGNWKK